MCYAEFCHTTSIQMGNSWCVIGKKYLLTQWTFTVMNWGITKPLTTDNQPMTHWQVLHWPTNCWPTNKCPLSHWPLATDHRQVLHWSINHQSTDKCSIDHRLTDRSSNNPVITGSSTLLQLTNNPLTHQSYFNRVTIGPILSITNFNSSFGMGTFSY